MKIKILLLISILLFFSFEKAKAEPNKFYRYLTGLLKTLNIGAEHIEECIDPEWKVDKSQEYIQAETEYNNSKEILINLKKGLTADIDTHCANKKNIIEYFYEKFKAELLKPKSGFLGIKFIETKKTDKTSNIRAKRSKSKTKLKSKMKNNTKNSTKMKQKPKNSDDGSDTSTDPEKDPNIQNGMGSSKELSDGDSKPPRVNTDSSSKDNTNDKKPQIKKFGAFDDFFPQVEKFKSTFNSIMATHMFEKTLKFLDCYHHAKSTPAAGNFIYY